MARRSTELQLFEALETYTHNVSFSSKASFIEDFLKLDLDLNNTQQSLPIEEMSEEEEEEDRGGEQQEHEEGDEGSGSDQEDNSDSSEGDSDESSLYLEVNEGNINSSMCSEMTEEGNNTPKSSNKKVRFLGGNGRDALLKMLLQKHHRRGEDEEDEGVTEGESMQEQDSRLEDIDEEKEEDEEEEEETDDQESSVMSEAQSVIGNKEPVAMAPLTKESAPKGPDPVQNWSEYFQLMEMKRALEDKQAQLAKEKESFLKVKNLEENRLKTEKRRVDSQRKTLQDLMADYNKIKNSKEEYEGKIKNLSEQLRETKLQMNKRISRWSDQQKRLEERVKALEKENEELKKKGQQQRSVPARLAALKRPPMRCVTNSKGKPKAEDEPPKAPAPPIRRVQFAEDVGRKSEEDEQESKENLSRSIQDSSASSTSTLFNESFFKSPDASKEASGNSQSTNSAYEKEVHLSDDEADKTMPSDYTEVKYPCGTITRITKDHKLTRHILINNDVMDEYEDASVRYYYKELGFAQTTYPNGDEVIEYDSGEIETKRADGSKIYTYSNGLVKMIDGISGSEEVVFGDGSVMKKSADGLCTTITWPSGQKEERTPEYVKRIYTNGTVKIMYQDGAEETRYFNGRVRRKDKNGRLVDDTKKNKNSA